MSIRSRQQRLLEHVNAVGISSVGDLSRMFGVSEMTIRRDINHLAESRLLVKVKGGAQRLGESSKFHEAHLKARMQIRIAAKQRLAQAAAGLIEPGDTLFLDGSTTIICLAQVLARRDPDVSVVTNSALVELELAETRNVRLIGLGGVFDHETFSFCPMDSPDAFAGYHVRKAFLSCTGLVVREGTYENSAFNMSIKRSVARSADVTCLLADAGKLGQRALHQVLAMDEVDVLITEGGLSAEQAQVLAEKKVKVHLVPPSRPGAT